MEIEFMLGAVLTLMTFTIALKENPVSRLVEHMALGIGGGYAALMAIKYVWDKGSVASAQSDYTLIITLLLGFLLYARFSKKMAHLSRIPVAVMIGTLLGLASRAALDTQVIRQIDAAMNAPSKFAPLDVFNFVVMLASTLCVLSYFIFMFSPTGRAGPLKNLGRYMLLVGFGATFGNMIMGVFSRLVDRLIYLLMLG